MVKLLSEWLFCLKLFVQMTLFNATPARLPYSPACLILTLVAYLIAGQILLGDQRSFLSILAQIALEFIILLTISFVTLRIGSKIERLLQTMTALSGVSLIISIVSIPILFVLPEPISDNEINPVTLQINLLLLLWNLAVISLIFKRSFEINTLAAGFIAFNYFLLYELILLNFF